MRTHRHPDHVREERVPGSACCPRSRREFLAAGLAAAAGAVAPWGTRPAQGQVDNPPNIVLLLTDDQRWDTINSAGNDIIETPFLNRLAAEGVRFSNAFVTTAICCTSRASILTGMHVERHGIGAFNQPLSERHWNLSLPMQLKAAGYTTAFVGKWGLGGAMPEQDFDYWKGFPGQGTYFEETSSGRKIHRTQILSGQAQEFLDSVSPEKPFFLQVSFKAPHCLDGDPKPFHPDPRFSEKYKNDVIPVPPTATEEDFAKLPEFLQNSEARERWKIRFANPELFQNSVKDYYRLITGVDDALGQIREKLEEKNLSANTVILFTSDNGFYLGEHGLAGKWFMHEESIRVPLILHDPRLAPGKKGQVREEMALNIDIAPTLLDYAGIAIPPEMQGRSLKPLVEGDHPSWRTSWFYSHPFQHPTIARSEGIRTETWKYVRYIDTSPVYEELYRLEQDPHETENLAENRRYQSQLEEMRSRWEQMRKSAV